MEQKKVMIKTALLVEDDFIQQEVFKRYLEQLNYQVEIVDNGLQQYKKYLKKVMILLLPI